MSGLTGTSTETSVSLSWSAPSGLVATGYSSLTGYDIYMSNGAGFSLVQSTTQTSNVAITGTITNGTSYSFQVRPKNVFGAGPYSATFTIIASVVPGQPNPPVLSLNGSYVKFSFLTPSSNGSAAITGYQIKILDKSDGVYKESLSLCNGSSS